MFSRPTAWQSYVVLDTCRYTHLLCPISVLLPVQCRGFRHTVIVPSIWALIAPPTSELAVRLPRRLGVTAMPAQRASTATMWAASNSEGKPNVRHCRRLRDVQVPCLPQHKLPLCVLQQLSRSATVSDAANAKLCEIVVRQKKKDFHIPRVLPT